MNEVEGLARQITSLYGTVKRARGCYLYTAKGVRLTDLYLEGGRAVLGWGSSSSSAFTLMKNVIGRGVCGSFETDFSVNAFGGKSRMSRAVSELFNSSRDAFYFYGKAECLKAAVSVSPESTGVYMPWNQNECDWSSTDCIVFVPPFAWAQNIYVLAVKSELSPAELNGSRGIPAPVETAMTRSIYDLIRELQNRSEKDWFKWDTVLSKYWERKGPYLYPKVSEVRYADFVKHCLENEIVISPVYNQPSVVPYGAERSIFRKLEKNPFAGE